MRYGGASIFSDVVRGQSGIHVRGMNAARHEALAQGNGTNDRLERACGAQRMAGRTFGRAAGRGGAEDAGHGVALGSIVP